MIDIGLTIVFHHEGALAVPALASMADMVARTTAAGVGVETRAILDRPDYDTRRIVHTSGAWPFTTCAPACVSGPKSIGPAWVFPPEQMVPPPSEATRSTPLSRSLRPQGRSECLLHGLKPLSPHRDVIGTVWP